MLDKENEHNLICFILSKVVIDCEALGKYPRSTNAFQPENESKTFLNFNPYILTAQTQL